MASRLAPSGSEPEHLLGEILRLTEQLPEQRQGTLRIQAMNELATELRLQGRLDDAQAVLRMALDAVEANGSSAVAMADVAHVAHELGAALAAAGRTSEAATLYERSLAINEKVLKSCDTDSARTLHNLALLYDRSGQSEQADWLWAQGRRRYELDHASTIKEKESARS